MIFEGDEKCNGFLLPGICSIPPLDRLFKQSLEKNFRQEWFLHELLSKEPVLIEPYRLTWLVGFVIK